MPNAHVYSADSTHKTACTFDEANRLLHLGHARIVKFYPFSVQLKSQDANEDGAHFEPCDKPNQPSLSPLTQSKKCKIPESKDEVAHLF